MFFAILIAFSKLSVYFLSDFVTLSFNSLLYSPGAALYILLVLSPNINTFGDDLISEISDFIFSWKLPFKILNFTETTMLNKSFQNYLILSVGMDDVSIWIQKFRVLLLPYFLHYYLIKNVLFNPYVWSHFLFYQLIVTCRMCVMVLECSSVNS